MRVPKKIRDFVAAQEGATAIEYALIAAFMGFALLPVLTSTTAGVAQLYEIIKGLWVNFTS